VANTCQGTDEVTVPNLEIDCQPVNGGIEICCVPPPDAAIDDGSIPDAPETDVAPD
jgi:hypothetical protein